MARTSELEILADILTMDYGYTVIEIGMDYLILSQTMVYIVDVAEDLQEIMHVYPEMNYVRYEVNQSSQGILIELM